MATSDWRSAAHLRAELVGGPSGDEVFVPFGGANLSVKAVRIGIGTARAQLPQLIRESAKGRIYVIANSKNPNDGGALLISPSELARLLEARPRRTMEAVLRSMPFAAIGPERIVPEPLPGDGLPSVHVPD